MAVLTDREVMLLILQESANLHRQGYKRSWLLQSTAAPALAIAIGESGLDPAAHNLNASTDDNSYGLFQINMFGDLGPERRQRYGLSSNEALFDPSTNVRTAIRVWIDAGNSFRPWSVFNHGTYLTHLPRGIAAYNYVNPRWIQSGGNSGEYVEGSWVDQTIKAIITKTPVAAAVAGVGAAVGVVDALNDWKNAIIKIAEFITDPSTWLRLATFIGGGAFIILGVLLVASESKAIRTAVELAPQGKAVSGAVKAFT